MSQEGRDFPDLWSKESVCPRTGVRWLLDYPHSELHGGGPPRLRTSFLIAHQLRLDLELAEFLFPDDPVAVMDAAALREKLRISYGDSATSA